MPTSPRRFRPIVFLALAALLFTAAPRWTAEAAARTEVSGRQRGPNGHLRLGRDAPGPHAEVRQGRRHADLQEADEGRRDRRQRDAPGVPAEHRRRLVHDGDRRLSGRPRLDQQHLLPAGRRVLEPDVVLGRQRPAGGHHRRTPRSAPARRSPRSTGSVAQRPTSPARRSTSRTSSRTAASSSAPRSPSEQNGSTFFGVTYQVASLAPASGWTDVPVGDPLTAAQGGDLGDQLDVRGPEPEPDLQRLLLRQRRRTAPVAFDHVIVSPIGKTGVAPSIDARRRFRLRTPEAHGRGRSHRRPRRPDGRPLHQAHRAGAGCQPVQAVRHVPCARDRDMRRRVQRLAGRRRR